MRPSLANLAQGAVVVAVGLVAAVAVLVAVAVVVVGAMAAVTEEIANPGGKYLRFVIAVVCLCLCGVSKKTSLKDTDTRETGRRYEFFRTGTWRSTTACLRVSWI